MMPNSNSPRTPLTSPAPCKFVDSAITLIHKQFRRRGIPDKEIITKLFGGAFTMNHGAPEELRGIVDVGGRNVSTAKACLQGLGLRITKEDTMGERGRKLVFDTSTGTVWVKLLGKTETQIAHERVARR